MSRLSPPAYLDTIYERLRAERPGWIDPCYTVDEVDRALRALAPLERTVLLASSRQGLAYRTIARRLGIATADVERIMARALFHLRCALDDIERGRTP